MDTTGYPCAHIHFTDPSFNFKTQANGKKKCAQMTGHGLNCVNCCCSMPRWQVLCFCRRATSTCPLPPPTTTLFVQQLPVFFYLFLSLPQQNRYVRFDTKVNVCFDLMCDVRPKASSHNAVPMGSILFVKM